MVWLSLLFSALWVFMASVKLPPVGKELGHTDLRKNSWPRSDCSLSLMQVSTRVYTRALYYKTIKSPITPGPACSKDPLAQRARLEVNSLSVLQLNNQIHWYFLSKKWEKLLHCKSFSHFFDKKYWHIWVINVWNFNVSLTNDIVSFEQPDPDARKAKITSDCWIADGKWKISEY